MTALSATVSGVRAARRRFLIIEKRATQRGARRGARKAAQIVRDHIKATAPQDSGRLRRNIKAIGRRGKRTYQKASVVVKVGENRGDPKGAHYWRFVEHGTEFVRERLFIQRGARRMLKRAGRTVFREVDRELRRSFQ